MLSEEDIRDRMAPDLNPAGTGSHGEASLSLSLHWLWRAGALAGARELLVPQPGANPCPLQ